MGKQEIFGPRIVFMQRIKRVESRYILCYMSRLLGKYLYYVPGWKHFTKNDCLLDMMYGVIHRK